MTENYLHYHSQDKYVPIPPAERDIPTVVAEPVVKVDLGAANPATNILEGLNFDRHDNLYICCPPHGDIFRYNVVSEELRKFTHLPQRMLPSALKVHRDGRLFVTAAGSDIGCQVAVLDPEDGHVMKTLVNLKGRMFDDLTFDHDGGFYLSDLSGTLADPSAGIFYVEPDEQTIHSVIQSGLIASNGIGLDPKEESLWVTEYGRGRLLHFRLANDRYSILPSYSNIPYYFTGMEGPDSLCVDQDGNVYVSMCGQGRFLVFNPNGIPISQILLPGRDHGDMLKSTHITIRPGTNEAYMCSSNLQTGEAEIFKATVYASLQQ